MDDDELIEYVLAHEDDFEDTIELLERICSEDEIEEMYKIQRKISKDLQDN